MTLEQDEINKIIQAIKNGKSTCQIVRGVEFVMDYDNEPETQGFGYDYDSPPSGRIKDNYTVKSIELWLVSGEDKLIATAELSELEKIEEDLNAEGWVNA